MRNTTFTKQFLTTAVLLLVILAALGFTFRILLGNYLREEKKSTLEANASAVAELASAYDSTGELEANWDFRISLSFAAEVADTDILVCDDTGEIVLCSCSDLVCDHVGKILDTAYLESVWENGESYSSGIVGNLYDAMRFYMSVPIVSSSTGENIGIVMVSTSAQDVTALLMRTSVIFCWTAIVVLLLAMAVCYIVTQSQTKSLRALAAAANRFGHGDFTARVNCKRGDTEEMRNLSSAFNTMAESLEQSETRRSEFIANVSHELKTPMTTIGGFVDGMMDGTIPTEKHPQYMKAVSDEVKRLSRLVRSMLELSRLQASASAATFRVFDICETAGRTLLNFEQKINDKALDVQVFMPEDGVKVLADPDAIVQVVSNLIDNAVKFSDRNGVLKLQIFTEAGKAVVTVTNTGATIDPQELPLLFDRFHKTDKSRSADRDGVGLGLYIAKTIIDNHSETIRVSSENGETSFCFTLALAK